MEQKTPQIPQTKNLFPGAFGKYYHDAEKTQYAGKVVKGKWVPASPEDIAKEKGIQTGTTSPAQKTTGTSSPEAPTVQQHDLSTTEGRKKAHHETVQLNIKNKFSAMWDEGIDLDGNFKLGAAGHEYFMEIGDMVDSDSYAEHFPFSYIYGIQKAFGRKFERKDEESFPTSVVNTNFETSKLTKDKRGNALDAFGAYIPLYDLVLLNEKYMDTDTFSKPINQQGRTGIENIITVTHEVIHSSSPRLYKDYETKKQDLKEYWDNTVMVHIEEGLTEYLARAITNSMINRANNENVEYDIYEHGVAYPDEVEAIDILTEEAELDPSELFQTAETFNEMVNLFEKHQRKYLVKSLVSAGAQEQTIRKCAEIAFASKKQFMPVFDKGFRENLRFAEFYNSKIGTDKDAERNRNMYLQEVYKTFKRMHTEYVKPQLTNKDN